MAQWMGPRMATRNDQLTEVRDKLSMELGHDLADSLVRAGRLRGVFSLDMQLAISDGLEGLTSEKRRKVLDLLDTLMPKS
jgi:hypothetical protein